MAVFKMSINQMAFPNPSFVDDAGNPVALTTFKALVYDAADPAIVSWDKRAPDGTPDPNGADAAVSQGLGTTQVHLTATNPDDTTVVLAQDVEIMAADATSGSFNFSAVVNKPPVTPPTPAAAARSPR